MEWSFDSTIEQQLTKLCEVFLEKNTHINLSALRTKEKCMIGNIYDSLSVYEFLQNVPEGQKILDIGTGGGFPLLPLAMMFPKQKFYGLDSIQKKINAVKDIALDLGLHNVQFICSRCELAGHKHEFRERFSVVTARAVAPLNILLEYMSPFTAVSGIALCFKSMHVQEELENAKNAQAILGFTLENTISYTLPNDFGTRQIFVFRKITTLDKQYPRAIGINKKNPL